MYVRMHVLLFVDFVDCLMSWGATDRVLFMPVQFLHQQQGHVLMPVHVALHLSPSH